MSEWVDEARRKRLALRALLADSELIVMPGGFSPVYARMAQEIGFTCFFLAGSQMSGFLLGVPDTGDRGGAEEGRAPPRPTHGQRTTTRTRPRFTRRQCAASTVPSRWDVTRTHGK